MRTWPGLMCVSLVCGLALDSNTIRSSKEATLQSSELPASCSNRAQRRTPADRPAGRQQLRYADFPAGGPNRTRAPEMAACVRSGDCAAGLCCVRYLTGKRCQRIPEEGDACLLRGAAKLRRNLGRCDCAAGLTCAPGEPGAPAPGGASAAPGGSSAGGGRAEPGKRRQGVCVAGRRPGQRKARRTAERGC